jgi:hypothetical protein
VKYTGSSAIKGFAKFLQFKNLAISCKGTSSSKYNRTRIMGELVEKPGDYNGH